MSTAKNNIFQHAKQVKAKHFTFLDVLDLPDAQNCTLANLDDEQVQIIHQALIFYANDTDNSKKRRVRSAKLVEAIEGNQYDRFEGKSNPIIPAHTKVYK